MNEFEGTSGISGWSGHGHAPGPDRSKDQYEAGIYLDKFNLSDDEIKEVLKESLEGGYIVFNSKPHQSISKKDNKYINLQRELNLILDYHRVKFGETILNQIT